MRAALLLMAASAGLVMANGPSQPDSTPQSGQFTMSPNQLNAALNFRFLQVLHDDYGFPLLTKFTSGKDVYMQKQLADWNGKSNRMSVISPSMPYRIPGRTDDAGVGKKSLLSPFNEACTVAARKHAQKYLINYFRAFSADYIPTVKGRTPLKELFSPEHVPLPASRPASHTSSRASSVTGDGSDEKQPLLGNPNLRRRGINMFRGLGTRTHNMFKSKRAPGSSLLPNPPRTVSNISKRMWMQYIAALLKPAFDTTVVSDPNNPGQMVYGCSYTDPAKLSRFKIVCKHHSNMEKTQRTWKSLGFNKAVHRTFECRIALA